MKLLRIDKNGYFIEDVITDLRPKIIEIHRDEDGNKIEVEVYDPSYITIECPPGFYRPRWDGTQWVEGLSQEEIEEIRNRPVPPSIDERVLQAEQDGVIALEGVAIVFEENLALMEENAELRRQLAEAQADNLTALEGVATLFEGLVQKGVF